MTSAPEAKSEPVVFGTAFQSIYNVLGRRITPELHNKLVQLGFDANNPQVAYGSEVWVKVLRQLAEVLARDVPVEDRFRELGRLFMRGFVQTPAGMASLAASKLLGLRRTLPRLGRQFRTATNYLETEYTEVSPNEALLRMWVSEVYLPRMTEHSMITLEYRQGALEEMVKLFGKHGRVEMVRANVLTLDATFRITWD